jgi:hypothetical protein
MENLPDLTVPLESVADALGELIFGVLVDGK